ncbi:hypothetical protein WJX77_011209 [Trebouxia sp. C0004]
MATNGDGFTDDSVKGPVSGKKNPKLQGPFPYEHKIKVPANDPELSQHVFKLPVDSEHKAKALNLFSIAQPHMRSFHLNWIGFFITFFSAYGAAPLIPTIRQDVGLTGYKANEAGVVTTAGTVVVRVLMGSMCDKFGPRYAYAFLLMFTSPFIFGIAAVHTSAGYIISRFLIGWALAAFVTCQFWTSIMFSPNVVGFANALAGGWGNAGGGVTQVVMPNLADGIGKHTYAFRAWRWAFFFPGCLQIIWGLMILAFSQDTPDGSYAALEKKGKKQKANLLKELFNGFTNYRIWLLAACYAYSFGVELAIDNTLAPYLGSQFGFSTNKAANLASIFGMMNFWARPLGGFLSDIVGRRFGMRGRLWLLWSTMTFGGLFTCLMGVAGNSYAVTQAFIILAAAGIEGTCGAIYGVVPFVSRRSCGLCCGLVSAGGAIGGVMNQGIFFLNTAASGPYYIPPIDAFKWMGVVMIAVSCFGVGGQYFPMWGGMFFPARKGSTEEDYYFAEYNAAEREKGYHLASSAFANESRSMRGMKRTATDAAARFKAQQEANGADDTAHGNIMDSSTSTTPMTNGATRNGV